MFSYKIIKFYDLLTLGNKTGVNFSVTISSHIVCKTKKKQWKTFKIWVKFPRQSG